MKLKYVKVSSSGIYQYRRVIPIRFRNHFGTSEIKKSLGRNYSEALRTYASLEAWYTREIENVHHVKPLSVRDRLIQQLKEDGASKVEIDQIAAGEVPKDSGLEEAIGITVDKLSYNYRREEELGKVHSLPFEAIRSLANRSLPEDVFTLSSALDFYLTEKVTGTDATDRQFKNSVERVRNQLIAVLGNYNVTQRHLAKFTKKEARAFRDNLLLSIKPNSVKRYIQTLCAALNKTIDENDLDCRNPVSRLEVINAGTHKDLRLPFSEEDIALLEGVMIKSDDDVLGAIWITLRDSGARLGEVCNLRVMDVNQQEKYMDIRPHDDGYKPKTKSSVRLVPLSDESLLRLQVHRMGLEEGDYIFPRYVGPRKAEKASAALMKRLRTVVEEERKSNHSLRHRMKDLLRNSGCAESLSREILGHSEQGVAANYGSGYDLANKRAALSKVWV
jgi:integrase